jgi:hypothetical protein
MPVHEYKNKQASLGQYCTDESVYITQGLLEYIPDGVVVVDPFAGRGDLLRLFKNHKLYAFDIDVRVEGVIERDTLLSPLNYRDKWVVTNPPYLYKGRVSKDDKELFDRWQVDNAWKAAVRSIIGCAGGILVIPFDFFTSDECSGVRVEFMDRYKIERVNVFAHEVMGVSVVVCSFAFTQKDSKSQEVKFNVFPRKEWFRFNLSGGDSYCIDSEVIKLKRSSVKVFRDVAGRVCVRQLDNPREKIRAYMWSSESAVFYRSDYSRIVCVLGFSIEFDDKQVEKLLDGFNRRVGVYRGRYKELWLKNYRVEPNGGIRKFMRADTVFKIMSNVILEDLGIE